MPKRSHRRRHDQRERLARHRGQMELRAAQAEMLRLRPRLAVGFAEFGHPTTWPSWAAVDASGRARFLREYDHWATSPSTYLTQFDPPGAPA